MLSEYIPPGEQIVCLAFHGPKVCYCISMRMLCKENPWPLIIIGVAPFFLIKLVLIFKSSFQDVFILYDIPQYIAQGREIFERGSGLFYPNPFDGDPSSPIIYFHLLNLLLGFLVKYVGLDPPNALRFCGIIGGLLLGRLTYSLIVLVSPNSNRNWLYFLIAMWGGGLFALAGSAAYGLYLSFPNSFSDYASYGQYSNLDPLNGLWFLNWGRNLILSTESVFHCLSAALWISIISRRYNMALCFLAVIVATHPWTAVQMGSIIVVWIFVEFLIFKNKEIPRSFIAGAFVILGVFYGYYFWYLNLFPQHVEIREFYKIKVILDNKATILGYIPVFLLATIAVWKNRLRLTYSDRFLIIAFIVSFILAHHDRIPIVRPVLPIHFARGYIWMPLILLGLPSLERALNGVQHWSKGKCSYGTLSAIVLVMFSLDNFAFIHRYSTKPAYPPPYYGLVVEDNLKVLFRQVNEANLHGKVLATNEIAGYVSASYTEFIPFLGHWHHTPGYPARHAQLEEWKKTGQVGPWFEEFDADFILIKSYETYLLPKNKRWKRVLVSGEWMLFERFHVALESPDIGSLSSGS